MFLLGIYLSRPKSFNPDKFVIPPDNGVIRSGNHTSNERTNLVNRRIVVRKMYLLKKLKNTPVH